MGKGDEDLILHRLFPYIGLFVPIPPRQYIHQYSVFLY